MSEDSRDDELIWWPEARMGYFPVREFPYDDAYFEKYVGYSCTPVGKELTAARVALVARYYSGNVVDIGIGCGQFVEAHGNAKGFDVNPVGKQWLMDRNKWCDFYNGHVFRALTFWDSLEHIKDISAAISRAQEFVFVSIPIFKDLGHLLRSKHFRKDEHYWYFTHDGLVTWFKRRGFKMLEHNQMEQAFGREDIDSYAFGRSNG